MSRRSRSRPVAAAKMRVKTARGRKISSTRWLQRQLNDPYVAEARKQGYRSRAAFKLIELDDQFNLLAPGMRVVDLGAAPGGWTQVVVERVRPGLCVDQHPPGAVIAVDLQKMEPLAGATVLACDMTTPDAPGCLRRILDSGPSVDQQMSGQQMSGQQMSGQQISGQPGSGGGADWVLSDMSPATTGHPNTDHVRIIALAESAYHCARGLLVPGGGFVVKVFQGGSPDHLLGSMKADFSSVRHFKPPASRKESPEMYVVARGFRAGNGGK